MSRAEQTVSVLSKRINDCKLKDLITRRATKLPASDPVSLRTSTSLLGWLGCDTYKIVAVRKSAEAGLVRAPNMEEVTAVYNLLVFFKLFCLVSGLDGPSGTAEEEEEEVEVGGMYTPLAITASE